MEVLRGSITNAITIIQHISHYTFSRTLDMEEYKVERRANRAKKL